MPLNNETKPNIKPKLKFRKFPISYTFRLFHLKFDVGQERSNCNSKNPAYVFTKSLTGCDIISISQPSKTD